MSKINREENEFIDKFYEQIALLRLACRNYDEGHEYAALTIAVSLRTLLFDNPNPRSNSVSILTHIAKQNIKLLTTVIHVDRDVNLGLVTKEYKTPGLPNGEYDREKFTIRYLPLCYTMSDRYDQVEKTWLSLADWFNQKICINSNFENAELNRLDIIKITADNDGGAHLDSSISEKFNYFRFPHTGLNSVNKVEMTGKILNIPVYPMLRQMAFELLYSLKNENLIRQELTLAWFAHFESINRIVSSLKPHDGYYKNLVDKLQLSSPLDLAAGNSSDNSNQNDN